MEEASLGALARSFGASFNACMFKTNGFFAVARSDTQDCDEVAHVHSLDCQGRQSEKSKAPAPGS
jgi:hypothetical protein